MTHYHKYHKERITLGEDIYIYLMTKMLNNAIVFWNIAISCYLKNCSPIVKFYTREMSILPRFAKFNTCEFQKFRWSRNFVPAKLNTFKVRITTCKGSCPPSVSMTHVSVVLSFKPRFFFSTFILLFVKLSYLSLSFLRIENTIPIHIVNCLIQISFFELNQPGQLHAMLFHNQN